ncbi:hypothetical protein D9M69_718680 [compost metagenome]
MRPVGVEERRCCRAVGQREVFARGPRPVGQLFFQPVVGAFKFFHRVCQSVLALGRVARQRPGDRLLHRAHHVQVEEAVKEANVEGGHRLGR